MLGHIGQRTVAALSDASGLAAQQIMAKHIRLASAIALRGGAIWHLAAVAPPQIEASSCRAHLPQKRAILCPFWGPCQADWEGPLAQPWRPFWYPFWVPKRFL